LLEWRRNEREFIDRMGGKGLVGVSKARASKRITGTKARRGKPSKRKRGGGCPFDPFSTSKYVYSMYNVQEMGERGKATMLKLTVVNT
jgi:hypothetical protein